MHACVCVCVGWVSFCVGLRNLDSLLVFHALWRFEIRVMVVSWACIGRFGHVDYFGDLMCEESFRTGISQFGGQWKNLTVLEVSKFGFSFELQMW
ncbi:hypothetical protein M758_7G125500 [Ceratodon purpureus]|nr:hypothetical protein M758_7G125500 [Ceratodon purpureus]